MTHLRLVGEDSDPTDLHPVTVNSTHKGGPATVSVKCTNNAVRGWCTCPQGQTQQCCDHLLHVLLDRASLVSADDYWKSRKIYRVFRQLPIAMELKACIRTEAEVAQLLRKAGTLRGQCQKAQDLAKVARDLVRHQLAQARRIDVIDAERGKYFRLVARLEADGVDLSALLIQKGLAVPYDGSTKVKDWRE